MSTMRLLALLALLCGPAAAGTPVPPDPALRVSVGPVSAVLDPMDAPELDKDAADLASFLLVHLARRKACPRAALPALYARLLPLIRAAGEEEPTRLRYLALLAPRLDEDAVTELFAALRDDPAGFARYLRARVRFHATPAAASEDAARDGESPGGPVEVPEIVLREYRRYQMHCPVIWVESRDGSKPDAACNYRVVDLQGLMDGMMGSEFKTREP